MKEEEEDKNWLALINFTYELIRIDINFVLVTFYCRRMNP